jgi:hypothetical protein
MYCKNHLFFSLLEVAAGHLGAVEMSIVMLWAVAVFFPVFFIVFENLKL